MADQRNLRRQNVRRLPQSRSYPPQTPQQQPPYFVSYPHQPNVLPYNPNDVFTSPENVAAFMGSGDAFSPFAPTFPWYATQSYLPPVNDNAEWNQTRSQGVRSEETSSSFIYENLDSAYGTGSMSLSNIEDDQQIMSGDVPEDLTDALAHMQPGSADAHLQAGARTPQPGARELSPSRVFSPMSQSSPQSPGDNTDLICEDCQTPCRTKAELKKHRDRHGKPHRCDWGGCDYSSGSKNDLDRHRRSRHNYFKETDSVWVCRSPECPYARKRKTRRDNFEHHVRNKHKNITDVRAFVDSCRISAPQPNTIINSSSNRRLGPSSSFLEVPGDTLDRSLGIHTRPNRHFPRTSGSSTERMCDAVSRRPQPTSFSSAPEMLMMALSTIPSQPNTRAPPSSFNPMQTIQFQPPVTPASTQAQNSGVVIHQNPDVSLKALEECLAAISHTLSDNRSSAEKLAFLFEQVAVLKSAIAATAHRQSAGDRTDDMAFADCDMSDQVNRPSNSEQKTPTRRYACDQSGCTKKFTNGAALTKHIQRHYKLYGCTYDDCEQIKVFGSNYDWQRHENSLHFKDQDEVWRCTVEVPYTGQSDRSKLMKDCGEMCSASDALREHLKQVHPHEAAANLEELIENGHLGYNVSDCFWCGFCRQVTRLRNTGENGWLERFEHIARHWKQTRRSTEQASRGWPCANWLMLFKPWTKEEYEKRPASLESSPDEDILGSNVIEHSSTPPVESSDQDASCSLASSLSSLQQQQEMKSATSPKAQKKTGSDGVSSTKDIEPHFCKYCGMQLPFNLESCPLCR